MARLPNTATKAERQELHRAKMAGKKFDRERNRVEITDSMARTLQVKAWKQNRARERRLFREGVDALRAIDEAQAARADAKSKIIDGGSAFIGDGGTTFIEQAPGAQLELAA